MHHPQICITEPGVIKHDHARLARHAHIARLLTQFSHGGFFGCFTGVDEAGGDLDADLVERGAVLLLEDDFGGGGFAEEGEDADAVDVAVFGAGGAFGVFPGTLNTVGVCVCRSGGRG